MAASRVLASLLLVGALVSGAHWANATGEDPTELRYRHLEPATHFDFPVGPPNAHGYYDAQGFGENFHLGEDWNGVGGGDSDLGDPVHAIADGQVTFAGDGGKGWGNVVRVVHHVRENGRSSFVESVYAHLDTMGVEVGEFVARGQQVGTIGDAGGEYIPHLHFEIRRRPDLPMGPGYSPDHSQYLDPTAFIDAHR
jgi:murein DD-endopeptidase MepM/ murein hydrolase activator NlpD